MEELKRYIRGISKSYRLGKHQEQSHRTEMHNLMRVVFDEVEKGLDIVQEVKVKNVYGKRRPDFVVFRDGGVLGTVETKNIGKKLSDKRYRSQVMDYSRNFPMIFTNYQEVHLIMEGESIFQIPNLMDIYLMEDNWEDLKSMVGRFMVLAEISYGQEVS